MKSAPVQSSPSVEVAGEELATQKEVKLVNGVVEGSAVARGEEVGQHRCLRSCTLHCTLRP
jgi:hypothetical protein